MSLKNITYLDLIEACQEPGCPACGLRQKNVESYLRMLFHEHINDPPSREKLRHSQGLCYEHLWLAIDKQLGNALAITILSHDVLGKLLKDVEDLNPSAERRATIKSFLKPGSGPDAPLSPEKDCPVCLHQEMVDEWILKVLVGAIQKPELSEALRQSEGVCLPHLRQSLELKASPEARQILLALASERWQALRAELAEFIRKNDYRYSQEGFGEERDAWLRASAAITGNRPPRA